VTNITLGLILAQAEHDAFQTIKSWFKEVEDWHLEPFAIIKILIDCILNVNANSIDTTDFRFTFLQSRMGQHTYHTRPRGDPLKMDFTWTMRVLNHGSTILAMNTMRVKGARTVLRNVIPFDKTLKATHTVGWGGGGGGTGGKR
jgi:hypothetical protein